MKNSIGRVWWLIALVAACSHEAAGPENAESSAAAEGLALEVAAALAPYDATLVQLAAEFGGPAGRAWQAIVSRAVAQSDEVLRLSLFSLVRLERVMPRPRSPAELTQLQGLAGVAQAHARAAADAYFADHLAPQLTGAGAHGEQVARLRAYFFQLLSERARAAGNLYALGQGNAGGAPADIVWYMARLQAENPKAAPAPAGG